jgi:hypothetical protein
MATILAISRWSRSTISFGVPAGATIHDGVAVRRHAGDLPGCGIAASAADVFDEELLAEIVGQLLGHDAGDGVGRSAGREADDDADRLGRIGFRR